MSPKNLSKEDKLAIVLDSIYYLHRSGDHAAANELVTESKTEIESSKIHTALLQLIQIIGKYEQNKLAATDYAELSNVLRAPLKEAKNCLYEGWLHFLLGYYLKKEEDLKIASELFQTGQHLTELLETYYWMNRFKILPNDITVNTFLRLFPVKSIYSLIMGNTFYKNEISPRTTIQKAQAQSWLHEEDEESFDCWFISGKNITPAVYKDLDLGDESYLDIYSGLINDRGEYAFLLLSELNCLSFLLASELLGTTLSQLAEFLNRSEEEAEVLINDVKKMGIPIKKQNQFYNLDWTNKPKIIIPRNLKVIGLQEYVKKTMPTFSKVQLIDLLQLTQYGAESLMKKWALAGFIRPVEKSEKTNVWKFL